VRALAADSGRNAFLQREVHFALDAAGGLGKYKQRGRMLQLDIKKEYFAGPTTPANEFSATPINTLVTNDSSRQGGRYPTQHGPGRRRRHVMDQSLNTERRPMGTNTPGTGFEPSATVGGACLLRGRMGGLSGVDHRARRRVPLVDPGNRPQRWGSQPPWPFYCS